MEPILCYPDPPPPDVVRALELAGYAWKAVSDEAVAAEGVWSAAIVAADEGPEAAFAFARALHGAESNVAPVLLLVRGTSLADLESRHV